MVQHVIAPDISMMSMSTHSFGDDVKHFIAASNTDYAFWVGISAGLVWLFAIMWMVNFQSGAADALEAMKSMGINKFFQATFADWISQTPAYHRTGLFGVFYTLCFLTLWSGHGHPYNLQRYSSPLFELCAWSGMFGIVLLALAHAFAHYELAQWVKNTASAIWSGEWAQLFETSGWCFAFIFEATYTYLYCYLNFGPLKQTNNWMTAYFILAFALGLFGFVGRFASSYTQKFTSYFPLANWCETFALTLFITGIGMSAYVLHDMAAEVNDMNWFQKVYFGNPTPTPTGDGPGVMNGGKPDVYEVYGA